MPDLLVVGIRGEQAQTGIGLAFHEIDDAVLSLDQRREFREQQAPDGGEVALALKHVGEAREVRLQPVLFGVALGGQAQIADHRVDVVFELRHFAAGFDLDGARQVALGDCRRDFGDGAHLGGEICRQQVHVAGEVLPRAGRAGHVRLAAEASFHADFAGNRRHLLREGGERIRHVVDRFGQRGDLALRGHGQVLLQSRPWRPRSPRARCRAPVR